MPEHKETIESIGQEAALRHVDYSAGGIEKSRRDVFKEVLGERIQAHIGSTAGSSATVQQSSEPTESDKQAIKNKSAKLQELVNLAATKGPIEASIMVQKIGDPWLEDQFHDVLIGFHDELVRRKKLSEE